MPLEESKKWRKGNKQATYYADDLKRDNGRVWDLDKAIALAAQRKGGACYVVEVCTGCAWNHLTEAFVRRTAG